MKTQKIFLASLIVFAVLLFFVPRVFIPSELGNVILTISTFLFGILAGFYIIVTTTDYNNLKNVLASETAGWINLYQNVLIYDKQLAEKLSLLIDNYIRRAFDFEIIDYARETGPEFAAIQKMLQELPLKSNLDEVYGKIREAIGDITTARQQLLVLSTKTLSILQWLALFMLGGILIFSLYGLRSGHLFFDVVTVAISSSIILILLLIRELDLYIWNEKTFGYDIFENVFKSVGHLPYYPIESLREGRFHPVEKGYRVGIFVDFPKSSERKIEVRKAN